MAADTCKDMASHSPATNVALRFLSVGIVASFILALPSAAGAQCAPIRDLASAIAAAPTVFVGEVVDVGTDDRIVELHVLSVWKGRDLPSRVEVRGAPTTDSPPSAADRRFEAGATYLVIPENTREPFLASACSATQLYSEAPHLIPQPYQAAVGASTGKAPVAGQGIDTEAAISRSVLPLLGALALIALTWGAISWLRSKRPERTTKPDTAHVAEPEQQKPRRHRKRSFRRDSRSEGTTARRLVKQNRRRWSSRRRAQERAVTSASATAKGSTDTS